MQTTHVSLWRCFLAIALVFGASGAVRGGAWQDAVLQSNPIHWYRMNETSGTAAADSATNGAALNGTYQNGFTLGKSGAIDGAVGFDGNYGRVFLGGDKLPDTQPWTAEFVIRRTHNAQDMILSSANNTHYLRQWGLYQYVSPVGLRTNEMIYSKGLLMPPVNATPLNKWAHVVWVGSTNAPASAVEGTFASDFWNWQMFRHVCESNKKPVAPGTLGLIIDAAHPALAGFPTDFHSDYQWRELLFRGVNVVLDDDPDATLIVQGIDNVTRNHRLGVIWEKRRGTGHLVVSAIDLAACADMPEARALRRSLLTYLSRPAN